MSKNKALENNSIPIEIANMIFDDIPSEMWSNPDNKFCYASIVDPYIIDLFVERLNDGLRNIIINDTERMDHIYNNMVYGIALDKYKARLVKSLTKINNIFIKNIIEDDLSDMPNNDFNYTIENPPYVLNNKPIYLSFINTTIDKLISKNGQCHIIVPSTFLIDVLYNEKYDNIKKRICGHVKKIRFENCNYDFNIGLPCPCAILYLDFSNYYDTFIFNNCGDNNKCKSLLDCNLIGDFKLIQSILNKAKNWGGDMMSHRIYTSDKNENNTYFLRYDPGFLNSIGKHSKGSSICKDYNNNNMFISTLFGEFFDPYISVAYNKNSIPTNILPKSNKNEICDCLYGTEDELNNWIYASKNYEIILFINIVLTISRSNRSVNYLPFIVKQQYNSDYVNTNILHLTTDEINLIKNTLKKFRRDSPWFKRYMCSQTNGEVTGKEIKEYLNKK